MKLGHNKYLCCFCNIEIKKEVEKVVGAGRKGKGSDQVVCPKCGNRVSQKTREELREKYSR